MLWADYYGYVCIEDKAEILASFEGKGGSQKLLDIAREEYYKANLFHALTDPENPVDVDSPHTTFRVGIQDYPPDREFIRHLRLDLTMLRSSDVLVPDSYGPGWY